MTMAWWRGDLPPESAQGYRQHFESIRASLPASLADFHERVTLHDARLRTAAADFMGHTFELELDGFAWKPDVVPEAPRRWRLRYAGVTSVTTTADPTGGLPGPAGYGDLGYDELDVIGAGLFEHRMLFSTSIELHVRFRDLVVS